MEEVNTERKGGSSVLSRILAAYESTLVARLEKQGDMAQRFLNLEKIGLKRHGEFIQSDQQILVLRSLPVHRRPTTPDLLTRGFV